MRVLMVSSNTTLEPYPVYPLGCGMVTAALARAGHEARQFDFLHSGSSLTALEDAVRKFDPELIGISIRNVDNVNYMNTQFYIDNVRTMVETMRKAAGCKIVLGGPGFSLIPGPILERVGADYGIIGEGEALMVELAGNASRGVYPQERLLGPETRLVRGEIPPALYDEEIMKFYAQSGGIASVQTKRGCTHRCVYCSYPVLEGKQIRQRDAAAVVDDVEFLTRERNAKLIFFIDSVFNDDEGAYMEVVRELEKRELDIKWTAFFKPSGLTEQNVALMKKTGLVSVEVGADAACDTTLKKMGKDFLFEDIIRANDLFAAHGVASANFFMFGGPGETEQTVHEGIANIRGLKNCVAIMFMGIRILPDTALARIAQQQKIISADDNLFGVTYYFSPEIQKDWLEKTLTEGFAGQRHCIFPPDSKTDSLRMLHKMGYSGPLWDLLYAPRSPRARPPRENAATKG
ncbi:MAG: lipid biosynthesis B12-binding/radical SAM protein [Nitrospinota bacterium]|nr:lipid biosynthesis B12-binding/radical SAM protein [Nitrospinota bacterium]MDH5678859.1 lipid biosynthesis B12-binding/radical SAM protein [Nitrospinota bacterium]